MYSRPLLLNTIMDQTTNTIAMVDTGCLSYAIVNSRFVARHKLRMFAIQPVPVQGIGGEKRISRVARLRLDIGTHIERDAYAYVLDHELKYDLILGLPWVNRHEGQIDPSRRRIYLRSTGSQLKHACLQQTNPGYLTEISTAAFSAWV
jgi:hypothetical protein